MPESVFGARLPSTFPWYFRRPQSSVAVNQQWLYNRATQQYFIANVAGGIGSSSLFFGQSPPISTGDIVVLDLVDSLGSAISPRADGTFSIAAGGDVSARTFNWNAYRNSAFDGAQTAYVNYPAPVATSSPVVIAIERNQSITPVDMSGYITDPLGNLIVFTSTTSFPGSVDISSIGTLSGTTLDVNSNAAETIRGVNIAGASVDLTFTLLVGNVIEPDVSYPAPAAATQSSATGLLAATYINAALGAAQHSATVPLGAVMSQSPAAGNELAPFSTVTIVLSLGTTGAVSITSQLPSQTLIQDTGIHTLDLAAYSLGASMYSVSPDTLAIAGSLLQLTTDVVGIFGPFTVSIASATDSEDFDPITYTVVPAASASNDVLRPAINLRKFLLS